MRWNEACRVAGYYPGTPHSLRHTGPSYDMIEQPETGNPYRRDTQVQARGRWSNLKSVLRYGKTFIYANLVSWDAKETGLSLIVGAEKNAAEATQLKTEPVNSVLAYLQTIACVEVKKADWVLICP